VLDGELPKIGETPLTTSNAGAMPTAFASYISKVINSVQHRKRNPRLKSLFNPGSQEHSLEPYSTALDQLGDYAGALKEGEAASQLVPHKSELSPSG